MRFDTRLVRVGHETVPGVGDIVAPVHLSTTYERRAQDPPRYFYGRGENPTREALERCLAALEEAPYAAAFSSGQAAAATALSLLAPGRRLVSVDDVYPGSDALFALAARAGIEVEYADLSDPEALAGALDRPDLGMVWLETPTNPLLKVVDIGEVARLGHARGALVLVDNTFASPYLQQPLALGADLTLYSTTKFIAGHGDVFGGALVYRDPTLDEAVRAYRTAAGNLPGALDCFLVHRGLKTLALRVDRQVRTARRVVDLLCRSPAVGQVRYPGLPDHPQYATAKAQLAAPGSIVSFEYRGSPAELLDRFRLFTVGVSVGAVHSLAECPALMTHRPLPAEVRARRGITDSLVRLSIGIEDPEDILEDLGQGLGTGLD